jgi:hypothetical protein
MNQQQPAIDDYRLLIKAKILEKTAQQLGWEPVTFQTI